MGLVWIFGYGSLIWRPGFQYEASMIGHIRGFKRVFYQGNDKHRGTPQRLGRVATLLEDETSQVWGRAFLVDSARPAGSSNPLDYLDERESKDGGYSVIETTFYPRDAFREPVTSIIYIALPTNELYVGPKPYPDMAREIIKSHGDCGSNVEYVLNVAEFMRDEVGDIDDEHLFMLEMHILTELENQIEENDQSFQASLKKTSDSHCSGQSCSAKMAEESRDEDFASGVSARKLRCVDI